MSLERGYMTLRTPLIAARGIAAELIARPSMWPDKTAAARLIWNAHLQRWHDETACPVAIGAARCRIRARDWFALQDVVVADEYRPALVGLPPDCRVIDIGANVGLFSAMVFSRYPGATVLAVEPSPDSAALLRRNVGDNPGFRWTAIEAALWTDRQGVALTNHALSSGRRVGEEGTGVASLPLADIVAQLATPDLVKIDIEGAEDVALRGSAAQPLAHVKRLVIELHPDRMDVSPVLAMIRSTYRHVFRVAARPSAKPLLVAMHERPAILPGGLTELS